MSLYDIEFKTAKGETTTLAPYKGKVLYIVNVASKCGLTPQYEGLEKISKQYKDEVQVLGFPANDFRGQEPGTDSEIQEFCQLKYNVTFPVFAKESVVGENKSALFKKLIELQPVTINREEMETKLKGYGIETTQAPEVAWNFEKFIVSKDGQKVERFSPSFQPDAEEITKAIENFKQ